MSNTKQLDTLRERGSEPVGGTEYLKRVAVGKHGEDGFELTAEGQAELDSEAPVAAPKPAKENKAPKADKSAARSPLDELASLGI